MSSIFRKDDNFVDKPNRNPFDLSYQNNLTTKFGVLKPVYCQEVIPGDTFKIKPTMAMRFMPQVFPVQTRMRAHMHFFYVRNRNLWKDWEDFIGKTKDGLVPPYIQFNDLNRNMLNIGGIADSFGVPVVTYSDVPQECSIIVSAPNTTEGDRVRHYQSLTTGEYDNSKYVRFASDAYIDTGSSYALSAIYTSTSTPNSISSLFNPNGYSIEWQGEGDEQYFEISLQNQGSAGRVLLGFTDSDGDLDRGYLYTMPIGTSTIRIPRIEHPNNSESTYRLDKFLGFAMIAYEKVVVKFRMPASETPNGIALADVPFGQTFPYANASNDSAIKVSALPFRGYEAIYNSFYRNAENNPLIIDGVPEYNKYNRTYEGGADTNNYVLFNRNWEDDFLTTALPSPQQGTAPLVGIVNRGDSPYVVTLSDEDGNLSRLKFTYQNGSVQVASDDDISQEVAGQLNEYFMESTNVGISIQDFRNVNSFQRWLENNIRKGFKYRDQIKGHFGVSVRYDILDMPEFIGGVSRDVSVQHVTQTSAGFEGSNGELGDYAGQAYAYGEGETISHYCDEHGFIIGILSVVPMANYSQMMPKYLMKRDAFDYYFPEFGKIGMQPILNKEVTTIESFVRGNADEVFGYQRAWYDYIARVDEVHGLFTSNLRNFLIGRTFKDVPQLSAAFSTIQNEQLNNIFYVDDDSDKILGQIYFDVTGVRPIPVYGIPSIE